MSTTTASPWTTKASSGEGGNYELPAPGSYPAVCVGIIDLGTHQETFQGETKSQHQIMFIWELTNEIDSKGKNFVVAQSYTWSLNNKAKFRGVVEGWTGKSLGDGEEFEVIQLMGRACVLTLVQGSSATGKAYIKVNQVVAPMKGLQVPQASLESFAFHLSMINSGLDDLNIPDWVPYHFGKPVTEKIKASQEFQSLPNF